MEILGQTNIAVAVEQALMECSDMQVMNIGDQLQKMGSKDKELGVVRTEATRRLWAAAFIVAAKADKVMAEARISMDPIDTRVAQGEFERSSYVSGLLRDLFWFEAVAEVGCWGENARDPRPDTRYGIREGWRLVLHAGEMTLAGLRIAGFPGMED